MRGVRVIKQRPRSERQLEEVATVRSDETEGYNSIPRNSYRRKLTATVGQPSPVIDPRELITIQYLEHNAIPLP